MTLSPAGWQLPRVDDVQASAAPEIRHRTLSRTVGATILVPAVPSDTGLEKSFD